ncbi:MAG TPA: ABC transporter ATP-binding protein [Candidatus Izemoplasmatales bacterium]|nr:ABC transporter ATP-binding protein [Bacillota bacterium]HRY77859.1 ABC transporter ATP-binding protein [Candidatus Izemoplasmatales bacterium]
MTVPILRMQGICKSFGPGIIAADDVTFSVNRGEIHALAGENGAGKTTLMKILYGLEKAQRGEIFLHDRRITINSPKDAMSHGIGMVHQHFMLVDELTVAENVVLGIEPRRAGLFDRKAAEHLVRSLSERYDMPVEPTARAADLNVATKQKVEILKVLARNAELIILDEPTAVLTPQETKRFFEQLKTLRDLGKTIVIITHKLPEIKAICDRITILRKGRTIGTYFVSDISESEISRKMIGTEPPPERFPQADSAGLPRLSVRHIWCFGPHGKAALKDMSFDLRGGEMLGVIGVEGNGQRELVGVLTGKIVPDHGNVILNEGILPSSLSSIRKEGVSFIPEDRMNDGVDLDASIEENVTALLRQNRDHLVGPFFKSRKLSVSGRRLTEGFDVRMGSLRDSIRHLSGGNMQKVVCAREIDACGTVLIADQPTRGVDVGSLRTIHDQMEALRAAGKGILLISSDLQEIRALCRRAIILHQGTIAAEIDDLSACSEEELGLYMLGIKRQEPVSPEVAHE